jgi:hypothetical protein
MLNLDDHAIASLQRDNKIEQKPGPLGLVFQTKE